MKAIRIKDLRCLKDTGRIELKPLTLLVGKNSSGKSTLLRFFPLMKQTLETRTNEPILWYSSRFVDFGSFEESINYESDGTIGFEFNFDIDSNIINMETFLNNRSFYRYMKTQQQENRQFDVALDIETNRNYIRKYKISIEGHCVEVEFRDDERVDSLKINGQEFVDPEFMAEYMGDTSYILPRLYHKQDHIENYFKIKLFKIFKDMAYVSTKDETISDFIENLEFGSSAEIHARMKNQNTTAQKLLENLNNMGLSDQKFKDIETFLVGMYLNPIVNICNKKLMSTFSGVKYIAPLRASAERYYRIQGLSLNEIDPRGENIPMVLHNMSEEDREEFNEWLLKNFGFELTTNLEGGHTSLKLKYSNFEEINLADTGFGFSQILPIIIILWQTTNIKKNSQSYSLQSRVLFFTPEVIITIEQPELHLHPAIQAKLIDTFAQIVLKSQESKINVKIIIETHSETMINRIGYLIAKKVDGFNSELVNVCLFNQVDNFHSKIESTSYAEKGYLLNWPVGFFSPEDL